MVWETDRWAGVCQITALPPGKVQAPDELQVERMGGIKHGKANDVGLLVHDILQFQQGEILNRKLGWDVKGRKIETGDFWHKEVPRFGSSDGRDKALFIISFII